MSFYEVLGTCQCFVKCYYILNLLIPQYVICDTHVLPIKNLIMLVRSWQKKRLFHSRCSLEQKCVKKNKKPVVCDFDV
jgi:hypothetical protein